MVSKNEDIESERAQVAPAAEYWDWGSTTDVPHQVQGPSSCTPSLLDTTSSPSSVSQSQKLLHDHHVPTMPRSFLLDSAPTPTLQKPILEEDDGYPFGKSVLGRLMRRALSEESLNAFGWIPTDSHTHTHSLSTTPSLLQQKPSTSESISNKKQSTSESINNKKHVDSENEEEEEEEEEGIEFTVRPSLPLVTCRICLLEQEDAEMISPCKCSGHSSHVHRLCLDKWRSSSKNPMSKVQCDICKTFYKFKGKKYFKNGITFGSSAFVCYVTVFFYYFAVAYILGFFFQMTILYLSLPPIFASLSTRTLMGRLCNTIRMNTIHFCPALSIFGCYRYLSDLFIPCIGGSIFVLLNLGKTNEWAAILGNVAWITTMAYGFVIALVDIKTMADMMAPKLLAVILDNTDVVLDLKSCK